MVSSKTIGTLRFENGNELSYRLESYSLKIHINQSETPFLEGQPNWLVATDIHDSPLWIPIERLKYSPTNAIIYLDNKLLWIKQSLHFYSYPVHKNPKFKMSSKNFYFLHSIQPTSSTAAICNREEGKNKLLHFSSLGVQTLDENIGPHDFSGEGSLDHSKTSGTLLITDKRKNSLVKSYDTSEIPTHHSSVQPISVPFLHEKDEDRNCRIQILDFDNAVDFLRASYEEKKIHNPLWSYNSWSKKMGLRSSTSLLKIINRQRSIGADIQASLLSFFDFNDDESTFFSLLINHEKNSKKDHKLAVSLTNEIQNLQNDRYSWSIFHLATGKGLARRISLKTNNAELYFYNRKTACFTFIECGNIVSLMSNQSSDCKPQHPNVVTVPREQNVGFDQIGSHLFFYNKAGYLSKINLADFVSNPFSEGKWDSKPWINRDEVFIFYSNNLTKERFLVFAKNFEIFITYSDFDLTRYEFAKSIKESIEFRDKEDTHLLALPSQADNKCYYKNGVKHHVAPPPGNRKVNHPNEFE